MHRASIDVLQYDFFPQKPAEQLESQKVYLKKEMADSLQKIGQLKTNADFADGLWRIVSPYFKALGDFSVLLEKAYEEEEDEHDQEQEEEA